MKTIYIGFDGSNLTIQYNRDREKIVRDERFKNMQAFCASLVEDYPSLHPLIFVDYGILRLSNDSKWLKEQINSWQILQCERRIEADEYLTELLSIAPMHALIVSNDKFRDYKDKIPPIYSDFKWRFEAYYTNDKLKVPELRYQIENILEFDKIGYEGLPNPIGRELIKEYLDGGLNY